MTSPHLYLYAILTLLFLFLTTLYSLQTIASFLLLLLLIYKYAQYKWKNIMDQGLIKFLPKKIQKDILHRSLFDVLCDFWFIPNSSKYWKIFLKPFFTDINPENAQQVLQDLQPNIKENILRKGIINIFPQNIKAILYNDQQQSSTFQSQEQKQLNQEMQLQPVKWDRLQEFHQNQQQSSSSPIYQIKQNMQTLKSLLQFKSKGLMQNVNVLQQISYSRLFNMFIVSSALLFFQFWAGNKRRKQIVKTFLITVYVLSIIISMGSLAMLSLKYKDNCSIKQKPQQLYKKKQSYKKISCFDQ